MKKCIRCSFRVDKAQRPVGCHLIVVHGFEGFAGDGIDPRALRQRRENGPI